MRDFKARHAKPICTCIPSYTYMCVYIIYIHIWTINKESTEMPCWGWHIICGCIVFSCGFSLHVKKKGQTIYSLSHIHTHSNIYTLIFLLPWIFKFSLSSLLINSSRDLNATITCHKSQIHTAGNKVHLYYNLSNIHTFFESVVLINIHF